MSDMDDEGMDLALERTYQRERAESAERERDHLRQRVNELKARLDAALDDNARIQGACESAETDLRETQTELVKAKARYEALDAQNAHVVEQRDKALADLAIYRGHCDVLAAAAQRWMEAYRAAMTDNGRPSDETLRGVATGAQYVPGIVDGGK